MSDFITVSICLSDIPKDRIKAAENGKKYVNICVSKRKTTDSYGNTHVVYMSQSKEERESKSDKIYVGNGKAYTPTPVTASSIDDLPPASDIDDLPF